jgi:phosphoglycerate dehydrogenase-like enzyme
MKIVVSDPVFLPEEYRKRLEILGDLKVFDSIPSSLEELISRVKDAAIVVLGGRYGFPKDAFNASPNLKMISICQTG